MNFCALPISCTTLPLSPILLLLLPHDLMVITYIEMVNVNWKRNDGRYKGVEIQSSQKPTISAHHRICAIYLLAVNMWIVVRGRGIEDIGNINPYFRLLGNQNSRFGRCINRNFNYSSMLAASKRINNIEFFNKICCCARSKS